MENYKRRFVLNMLAYAAHRDINVPQLCKLSGVDFDLLRKSDKIIFTKKQLNDLWMNACHLTNDPLFGLHLGESMQLAALGNVGELIKTSNTAGDAITLACMLTYLVTDLFRIEVIKNERTFTLLFIPNSDAEEEPSFSFRQTMDVFMVFAIHELDGLILQKILPKAVKFAHNMPALEEYTRVLRCRPVKKTAEYSITFENKYLNEPILTANYELQNFLLQQITVLPTDFTNTRSLQARVYKYLLTNSYLGIVSQEEIALNFNLSPRSLQRKLKDEGVNYQQIADTVRKSLALNYLGAAHHTVKEISHILGYNELSAFTRAFKRWTGITPVEYRKLEEDSVA